MLMLQVESLIFAKSFFMAMVIYETTKESESNAYFSIYSK